DESDVDCGGSCEPCVDGAGCADGEDCASGVCAAGMCAPPSCMDGVQNGGEVDVDCRGPCPALCLTGQRCGDASDCDSGVCSAGVCAAPACDDGVQNGGESDVDCGGGGACPRCPDGSTCTTPGDCATGACMGGTCGSGVTYVGYANWTQMCQTQTDAQQDSVMDSACSAAFRGARAATMDELINRRIMGLPATNTSGAWLIPKCPGCAGTSNSACLSGHARLCVNPSDAWPTSTSPWSSNSGCYQTRRTALCVR
ncbi:MAG TPA: hypothetical protein DEF51_56695, partial [Myxococcales bacterium]|nr:hypothetical protein [Myxococcales bacterium]